MSTSPLLSGRKPQGYAGINHQTAGTDILSVLKTVHAPEITLGKELAARLRRVQPDQWYPISDMLELLERLDEKLGSFHLKQVGWNIIQGLPPGLFSRFSSAREMLEGMDTLYRMNNRGEQIGHWKVAAFSANRAELEKTTPHHCIMEEGIIEESLRAMTLAAKVQQTQCFRKGDPLCRYVVVPRTADSRWGA